MPALDAPDRALLVLAYGDARVSDQRLEVAKVVETTDGAFTVESLIGRVRGRREGVGTATVYRAVSAMLEAGFVERVGRTGGRELYLRCHSEGHHHHFLCTRCGSASEAPCPLDREAIEAAASKGFVVTRHEVSVYGLCGPCLQSPPVATGDA